jgi:hypothetical protein
LLSVTAGTLVLPHPPAGRVKTNAWQSTSSPINATLPSPESATDTPKSRAPVTVRLAAGLEVVLHPPLGRTNTDAVAA